MASAKQKTLEYEAFEYLQHWRPAHKIVPPEVMMGPQAHLFPLFCYLYQKVQALYKLLPLRKNGENPFIHPLNVVLSLQKARADDDVTLCVGILHDYTEEMVDLYKKEHKVSSNAQGVEILEEYEHKVFRDLTKDLAEFCTSHNLNKEVVSPIIRPLKLLTHHKRHFYFKYISAIFTSSDSEAQEIAIRVKLADRMHNILSVESFNEEERIYQCYKNMFILNNTKKYLLEKYGKGVLTHKRFSTTSRLFNKCARATFDAFLTICFLTSRKGILEVISLLQLAFKKFELEMSGLWVVTAVDPKQTHPFRLYQGVVRKYDTQLHHEWDQFKSMKRSEMTYCKHFFSDYGFDTEQLQAILDYKDAYSLKEVVAYLLYKTDYVVSGFLCSELSQKGRIK